MANRTFSNIEGGRFGRLVAVRRDVSRGKCTAWICRCDCGNQKSILTQSLKSGLTKSCGCLMRERSREELMNRIVTHGMRHTPEYSVWCGIKRRCNNPSDKSFLRYGGVGIAVEFKSFMEFFSEVGPRPSDKHSIDRIDPHGNYRAGNVRWETAATQARNKKKAKLVCVNGVVKPLADWCDEKNVEYKHAWYLLDLGASPESMFGVRE